MDDIAANGMNSGALADAPSTAWCAGACSSKCGKQSRDRKWPGQGVKTRDGQLVSPLRKDLLISAGEYSHRPASVIISCSDIFALVLTCCSALFLPAGPIKFCFGGLVLAAACP